MKRIAILTALLIAGTAQAAPDPEWECEEVKILQAALHTYLASSHLRTEDEVRKILDTLMKNTSKKEIIDRDEKCNTFIGLHMYTLELEQDIANGTICEHYEQGTLLFREKRHIP